MTDIVKKNNSSELGATEKPQLVALYSEQIFPFLAEKIGTLTTIPYFVELNKKQINTFLIGIYYFSNIIRHYSMLLATNLVRSENNSEIKGLSAALYKFNCENKNYYEYFQEFLLQFKTMQFESYVNYYVTEDYYKRIAITSHGDTLCNNLTKVVCEKPHITSIASLITMEYIFETINIKFNDYAKCINKSDSDVPIIKLPETLSSSSILSHLLDGGDDRADDIRFGILVTIEAFKIYFDELAKIC